MSEIQLQAKCYQWMWNFHPETRYLFFAVPNGGTRNMIEATQLKASGLLAGIPDCIFMWKGKGYGIEFKTDTGRLSPAQVKVHEKWQGHAEVYVVRSFDAFKELIEQIILT